MTIEIYDKWGNAREQARRGLTSSRLYRRAETIHDRVRSPETPEGMTPHEVTRMAEYWDHIVPQREQDRLDLHKRMDSFFPQSAGGATAGAGPVQDVLGPALESMGAGLSPGAGRGYLEAVKRTDHSARFGRRTAAGFQTPMPGGGGTDNTFITQQRPYAPEFESPDRQQYPVHRILANRYWRLFWKLDPVIGNCIEMYSEMPWGNFEMTGEGVEGEIKDAYEASVAATELRAVLPALTREYFITGEACPHNFFDDAKGIWTHTAIHNPDQLEVIHAPFIKMDPLVEFVPDDRLRQVLTSNNPMLSSVRDSMPDELISRLMSRQNIPLSPLNFTFIPRKLHDYDTRGTSLLSRMWRILMYEDAVFNASIATARRHAGPLKIAKLGDAATGYIPPPEQERRLLQLLAQAELDVNAWLVYHYAIQFEMVGTTDRIMSIDKHWELIERVKLVAMGISKAFLTGEVTYASAASGLTVFLQRLKALREFFEAKWIIPKFFKPLAQINNWVKPTPAELDHRIRVRRSSREIEEDRRLIIPRIEWDRSLDPEVDMEKINAMTALSQNLGVRFSKQTAMSAVNRDWEEETKQSIEEAKLELELAQKEPEAAALLGLAGAGAPPAEEGGGGGMPGGGGTPLPAVPEESFAEFPLGEGGEMPPEGAPPAEASKEGDEGAETEYEESTKPRLKSRIWQNGRYGDWSEEDVADLVDVFEDGNSDGEPWISMLEDSDAVRAAVEIGDPEMIWAATEDWLITEGYPAKAIRDLEDILKTERILSGPTQRDRIALAKELRQVRKTTDHLPAQNLLSGVGK
jgi:hypothetical protein